MFRGGPIGWGAKPREVTGLPRIWCCQGGQLDSADATRTPPRRPDLYSIREDHPAPQLFDIGHESYQNAGRVPALPTPLVARPQLLPAPRRRPPVTRGSRQTRTAHATLPVQEQLMYQARLLRAPAAGRRSLRSPDRPAQRGADTHRVAARRRGRLPRHTQAGDGDEP